MRIAALFAAVVATAIAAADEREKPLAGEPLREIYREEAEKCEFTHADGEKLTLAREPVMRWSNDDDWSGDVFVWTHRGKPEVIGCVLSGPFGDRRNVYQEFHLLAEKPIAPATVQDGRRWAPAQELKRERLSDTLPPASSKAARLAQMRKIARGFTASMEADGRWDLRLLPQPLLRYGDERGEVIDGALFCYVWTKGTDPEVILLLECLREGNELSWQYAPVLFTNRQVWLKHGDREVWHAEPHQEPAGKQSDKLFTTAFARSIPNRKADSKRAEVK